jgi:endoglucanase
MKPLLKKLAEAFGPAGFEGPVRDLVRAEIKNLPDYISEDPLGNLIAVTKKNSKSGKKVLLAAHMDEVGVMAAHVDERGFVRFIQLGVYSPVGLVGSRVRFAGGALGVIDVEVRREDPGKIPGLNELYIDVGATSRDDCPVKVGEPGVFGRSFEEAGGTRVIGKSLDNRVGVAILVETMRALKRTPHEVAFVFSVQQEVGARGAGPAACGLEADLGLAVDLTSTGDTPGGRRTDLHLGGGPAILARDAHVVADPRLKSQLVQRAQEARLKHQMEVLEGDYMDTWTMQVARGGLPVGGVCVPARHMHTPSEMIDLRDAQAAVNLLVEFLQKPIEM